MHRLIAGFKAYLKWILLINRTHGGFLIVTAFRVLLFRLFTNQGPALFELYGFQHKPIKSHKEYLFPEAGRRLQEAFAPEPYRYLEEDKVVFYNRCHEHGISVCPILAILSFDGNHRYKSQIELVLDGNSLCDLLDRAGVSDVIVKPISGGQGYGVERILLGSGKFNSSTGVKGLSENLFDYLSSRPFSSGGYIIQPRLQSHAELLPIMPGPGLGTIRINAFVSHDDSVAIPWAVIKMPRGDSLHDNWRAGKSDSLIADVNHSSGVLGRAVGRVLPDFPIQSFENHPVTGTLFPGFLVPRWKESLELVTKAARVFPELPALGWDVAVTSGGPVIIEANWNWSLALQQVAVGRGLKGELVSLLWETAAPRSLCIK